MIHHVPWIVIIVVNLRSIRKRVILVIKKAQKVLRAVAAALKEPVN